MAADPKDENFLERWSRRKRDGDDEQEVQQEQAPQEQQAALPQDQAAGQDSETQSPGDAPQDEGDGPQEPAAWEGVDIETLNADSDYTVFMAEGVPDNVKKEALDKLWRSDPVLANLDGLNDYDDDYSKWGMVKQVVKTAYKVGQGYLTDEEVAEAKAMRDEQDAESAAAAAAEEAQSDVVAESEDANAPETGDGDETSLKQAEADNIKPEIIDDEPDEVV